MPIHKINLPHTSKSNVSLSEYSSLPSSSSSPNLLYKLKRTDTTTSSLNLFKTSSKNLNNLNNMTSTSSLTSMLTNQTATTEYSPNLIDSECGDLLKVVDLDIDNNNLHDSHKAILKKKPSFHLSNNDSETENDDDTYNDVINDENDTNDHLGYVKLSKTSSNDLCGYSSSHSDKNCTNTATTNEKWAFILIGLPACGKSTMVKNFQDYVSVQTANKIKVKSYNAGEIRRSYEINNHHKFNFNDLQSSQKLRDFYAFEALKNLTSDLSSDVTDIGILDATNTTYNRRKSILDYIANLDINITPLFFEVKCSNRALRRFNIEQKSKNKDYIKMDHDIAINDFLERIQKYESTYEKVTVNEIKDLNVKYFGIDNVGDTIYYDCGLNHHNNYRHQNISFKSFTLNLLYQFLVNYRTNYASDYLTAVDSFYTEGHYHPIKTSFSKPVSEQEVEDVKKIPSKQINSALENSIPKVLSSSRIQFSQ